LTGDQRVRVSEDENVVLGSACTGVTDLRDVVLGLANHGDVTVARNRRGSIGTGVIDKENLDGRVGMGPQELSGRTEMVGRLRNAALLVKGRDYHRNRGCDGVLAAWTDSWHMDHKLMVCRGDIDATSLRLLGTYAAPPGPDWGWRIVIRQSEAEFHRPRLHSTGIACFR
jgi:hypothetical protein